MVPSSSIVMMAINAILGFAVPIGLACWFVKKYHVRWATILIGAATFLVFALVLESIVHQLVLNGAHGAAIRDNVWYYALYGGLMAGLFEETGRFLAMKFCLKQDPTHQRTAVAYGIGHGGVEMLFIFGITMISNIVIATMINGGQTDLLLSKVPAESQEQLQSQLQQLQDLSVGTLLIGLWERLSAVALHLGLSLLVFAAVRQSGRWWLYPVAIGIHAAVDATVVLLMKSIGMVSLEMLLSAIAIAVFILAFKATKDMNKEEDTITVA